MTLISFTICTILLLVACYDAITYRIPNWLVLLLLALYPVMLAVTPEKIDFIWALAAAAICLVAGFGLFALRLMGGGDVKLLTVAALWVGMKSLLPFLLYMALLGGALTILLLTVRNAVALAMPAIMEHPRWPRIFKTGSPVPYGIAIAAAMLIEIMSGAVAGVVMV